MTLPEAPWSKNNPGSPPQLYKGPIRSRIVSAIDRVVAREKAKNAPKPMSAEDKKLRAKELREAADAMERS